MNKRAFAIVIFALIISACGSAPNKDAGAAAKDSAGAKADSSNAVAEGTPVTVTAVDRGGLTDSIELNAVSTFLQKSYVKAIANGYLQSADIYPGRYVEVGRTLFTLQTKESRSIGNSIKILDTTLHFSGVN